MSVVSVRVTSDDIASGKRKDACHCPVALALKRAYPESEIFAGDDGELYTYQAPAAPRVRVASLPPVANRFIEEFDDGYAVQPFSFTLDIPDQYLRGQS